MEEMQVNNEPENTASPCEEPQEQPVVEETTKTPVEECPECVETPAPETAPAPDARIDELLAKMNKLTSLASERMMSYEVLSQFDKTMKGELTDVKNSSVKSLLIKVANVREAADDLVERMEKNRDSVTIDDAIDAVCNFGDMLEEILLVNGAVRFRDEAGTPYEYPRHNKAKVIDTENPALNKTVAEVVSSGYVLDDKVLLPEKINVYRYTGKHEE